MSGDIHIRREGKAGRITLTRPQALNALTYDMVLAIEAALIEWRDGDAIRFRARVVERDVVVLNNGLAKLG